jgi:enoyl-CoA hydratase
MTGYEQVSYERTGVVGRVRLARPRYHNAQTAQLLEETDHALCAADTDPEVRVIVVSGIGRSFSSGHDLGTPERQAEMAARRTDITEIENRFDYSQTHFIDMSLRWRALSKPTIAQVHGWCIFGGWMIAAAMDMIVASDDARFLTSLLQYFTLPYDVGVRQAKELLFDPQEISAARAKELGFVNRVVPRDRLDDEVTALAERIALNSPFWLRMAKTAINGVQDAAGFHAAITNAHALRMLAMFDERAAAAPPPAAADPAQPPRRRPMVERILGDGG